MLQREMLQRFAPSSLALIYFPIDTGSPGHDMSEHISKFASHRIDLQETQLIGGRIIGHTEHALGPADENELQHRILTITHAERQIAAHPFVEANKSTDLSSSALRTAREIDANANAVEFVRVIKECAGLSDKDETDARSLQVWASWAYNEIQEALDKYDSASGLSREQYRIQVVSNGLTKLGRWAMELTAVCATNEEQLAEEPEIYEFFGVEHSYTDGANEQERKLLRDHVYLEVLSNEDTTDPFAAELKSIKEKLSHSGGFSKTRRSQSDEYKAYLSDEGVTEHEFESLLEDFERVTEQYTEDGAISLHMSDGEKFIVDGTIDEDIDADYLPSQFAHVVSELRTLFTNGTPFSSEDETEYTIQTFIDRQLDLAYGNRADEDYRATRTIRTTAYLPLVLRPLVASIEAFAAKTREEVADHVVNRHAQINSKVRHFANTAIRNSVDIPTQFQITIRRMLPAIVKDGLSVQYGRIYEFDERRSVYVNAEKRRYVEEVFNHILQNMSRDFILSSKRHSKLFRSHARQIEGWTDTRKLIECIKQAYEDRCTKKLTLKQFTALNTLYHTRCATLEAKALVRPVSLDRRFRSEKVACITDNMTRNLLRSKDIQPRLKAWIAAVNETDDPQTLMLALHVARRTQSESRLNNKEIEQLSSLYRTKSILIQEPSLDGALVDTDIINVSAKLLTAIETIRENQLPRLAIKIHTLPLQEKERVRNALRELQPYRYAQIKTNLTQAIQSASTGMLMYLRFAFYEDQTSGAPNQPDNLIHLLTRSDRAEIWEILKSRSGLPRPTKA